MLAALPRRSRRALPCRRSRKPESGTSAYKAATAALLPYRVSKSPESSFIYKAGLRGVSNHKALILGSSVNPGRASSGDRLPAVGQPVPDAFQITPAVP